MSDQVSTIYAPPAATVLVVDDEPFIRVVLADALNEAGYIAIEAENAEVAVDMLHTHSSIDVLITDINLDSGFDGHHVALKAYRRFPSLKVILMTGDVITSDQFSNKPAMADGFLQKPFRLEDMWQLVESLLQPNPQAAIQ
jgi:CheY-like chemotaxis protein